MNVIETNWNWNDSLVSRSSTEYIALHHAAAIRCTVQQIDDWHKGNGWSGIGYHYFVSKDGVIYRGRPEWALGAHVSGMNFCSIGICAEGNYDIEKTMPKEQYNSILNLIKDIQSRYPSVKVVGHRDIGASDCPGKYYPLEDIKNDIKNNGGLTMTQYEELKEEITFLREENEKLKSDIDILKNPMIYNYIDKNMPSYYTPTIEKLVRKGILKGNENGELMLTEDMMRTLTILDRVGIFD